MVSSKIGPCKYADPVTVKSGNMEDIVFLITLPPLRFPRPNNFAPMGSGGGVSATFRQINGTNYLEIKVSAAASRK